MEFSDPESKQSEDQAQDEVDVSSSKDIVHDHTPASWPFLARANRPWFPDIKYPEQSEDSQMKSN